MGDTKTNNVVEKLDQEQLAEHQANLDVAYRQLQKAYKAMTYEVGRLEDEPGMSALGEPAARRLENLAERLKALGLELQDFVTRGNAEAIDEQEEDTGPQGAD